MRFLVLGCLHGQIPKLKFKAFDAILCTGDFCSDAHRPAMFAAIKQNLETTKRTIRWYDLVGKKEAKRLIDQSLHDGKKLLEYLDTLGVPVYVVPGNNDWTGNDSAFAYERKNHYKNLLKGLRNVRDLNGKMIDIGELCIIGYGESSGPEIPQHPQDLRRMTQAVLRQKKVAYARLKSTYSAMFERTKKPVILLSHNVPLNTKIDRIKNPASPRNGQHFGSLLVRELVETHRPAICLGAHMHEHFGFVRIGNTPCVNAGYGAKCNVLLELNGKQGKLRFSGNAQKY